MGIIRPPGRTRPCLLDTCRHPAWVPTGRKNSCQYDGGTSNYRRSDWYVNNNLALSNISPSTNWQASHHASFPFISFSFFHASLAKARWKNLPLVNFTRHTARPRQTTPSRTEECWRSDTPFVLIRFSRTQVKILQHCEMWHDHG